MSEICIVVTIVVYLAAMLLVGFAYSKTNNDSTDFYLGGRKMGPLVTAMSAEASDMSSWLLMGMPVNSVVYMAIVSCQAAFGAISLSAF